MKKSLVLAAACASLLVLGDGGPAYSAAASRSSPALSAFGSAVASVTAYSTTIAVFEQKGIKVQNVIFKYTFRAPSTVTVDVVAGPNSGVALLWTGGATVSAHRGTGLAGIFKETMSLHDPRVTTIRGSSIDELSFAKVYAHAQQTAGTIIQTPGMTINNEPTDAVTLIPVHPATTGYTREIIEISRTTHFPVRVLGYQGSTLVRQINFVDVKLTS